MTTHELARKLLEAPDAEAMVVVPMTKSDVQPVELLNYIPEGEDYQACMVLCGSIDPFKYVDSELKPDLKRASNDAERDLIMSVLKQFKYKKSAAAKFLDIHRKTLYNKMKKYGI